MTQFQCKAAYFCRVIDHAKANGYRIFNGYVYYSPDNFWWHKCMTLEHYGWLFNVK